MPELPEVETIKRGLSKLTIKQKIKSTEVLCEIGQRTTGNQTVIAKLPEL